MAGSQQRRAHVRAGVGQRDLSALLVTDPANIRYLTGFRGSNGLLVVGREEVMLVTDARYAQAPLDSGVHRIVDRGLMAAAVGRIDDVAGATAAGGRIGYDPDHLTVSQWRALVALVGQDRLVAAGGIVEDVRRSKDHVERAIIERACQLAQDVLGEVVADGVLGRSERAVAWALDTGVRAAGADVAFDTIVAAGAHSAIPHHEPTDRPIGAGDLLKIDMGARMDGYHSDITRTFVVGADATEEQHRWHEAVQTAARLARECLRAGLAAAAPYRIARQSLHGAGLARAFTHGLGHGVGLQIHEAPILTASTGGRLREGDVLTVEPGVYLPDRGGVRIEDTLIVTQHGSRSLTTISRELLRLD